MKNVVNVVIEKATDLIGQAGFALKKHSPEILIVGGIAGMVVSTVLACKATTKAGAIIETTKNDLDCIRECQANEELKEQYSDKDAAKDLTIVYTRTAAQLIKLYGPAMVLGTASIICILASHKIVRGRNAALSAAYATISKGFDEYRQRVVDRYGERVDKELKYNMRRTVEEEVIDTETGEKGTIKKEVDVPDLHKYSDYARFFDDANSTEWVKSAEKNLMFIRAQQMYANDLLQARKFVFLNDIYKMLGMEPTKAGQVIGWVYGHKDSQGRESFIDFGIFDLCESEGGILRSPHDRSFILDFNVHGNIFDLDYSHQYIDEI